MNQIWCLLKEKEIIRILNEEEEKIPESKRTREVGRRVCESNKYKTRFGGRGVRLGKRRENKSRCLKLRCCPPLIGHPMPPPAVPAG